jgi:hypothetical protein
MKNFSRIKSLLLVAATWFSIIPPAALNAQRRDRTGMDASTAVTVQVDASANRHAISPLIYGTAFATSAQLLDLNAPLNRSGGNPTSRYNWQQNVDNRAFDWYFESIPYSSSVAGELGDTFIQDSRNGGAQPLITIPLTDWVAKAGPNRTNLSSFSVAKYGGQTDHDPYWPDAGNGVHSSGTVVTGNDKNDANVPNSVAFEQGWVQHLLGRWGNASAGGLRYYLLDNESSIWFSTHRDVQPTGATMDEIWAKMRDYSVMIKNQDANAQVLGPEEWGWDGYLYSGYDQQYARTHGWTFPDRAAHGNADYAPWLLQQFKNYDTLNGRRLLDVFTLHIYPQGGEFGNDTSSATQLLRNRSTRSLWDPSYIDESWINDKVMLIPRMKNWVATYYPNTKIGITEYNWGAEGHINGATAQADILGILGRESVDMATRWTTPDPTTPTYKAMKMFRNYDGSGHGFGDTSVSATAPSPDNLSAFAALRSTDGALTVMVVNKSATAAATTVNLSNFTGASTAQVWQLTSANQITHLADTAITANAVNISLPAQSITMLVLVPTVNNQISGTVTYGIIGSQGLKYVPHVLFTATGTPSSSGQSDLLGAYLLTGLTNGNYTVSSSKSDNVNGISAYDATLTMRYVAAGGLTLTPNQQIAADADGNGTVTLLDATQILRFIAAGGQTGQTGQAGNWKFLPPSRSYAPLASSVGNENYEAILVGEVSGNWTPPAAFANPAEVDKDCGKTLPNSPTAIDLSIPVNLVNISGSTITIPVSIVNTSTISGYQFAVTYDPTVLQPANPSISTTGTLSASFNVVSDTSTSGRVGIAAAGGNNSITGTGTLLNLRFTVIGQPRATSGLNFINVLSEDDNGTGITTTPSNGLFTVTNPTAAGVSVSGRILTSDSRPIRNVLISIKDDSGETQTALTGPFGYYRFENVVAGRTYVLTVSSRRYRFSQPSVIRTVSDDLTGVDFVAEP